MKLELLVERIRKVLKIISGLIALSGLVNFIFLIRLPTDIKNAVFLGYSSNRLAILGILFIGSILFIFASIKLSTSNPKTIVAISKFFKRQDVPVFLILLFLVVLVIVWITGFSPEYFLKGTYTLGKRLFPVFIWLLSILAAALGFRIFLFKDLKKDLIYNDRKYWRLLVLTTSVVVLLFLFIAWIYPKLTDQLWFGRYSVPILATQIFIAWLLTMTVMLIPGNFWKKIPVFLLSHTDLFIFISIWIVSAFFWVNQPIEFFGDMYSTAIEQHIKPLPNNYEIYPLKDSVTYYNVTESVVTGGGIYRSIDKSLFLAFEGLNNWLAGGSYEKMLDFQTILLASFPAVIYLLGSKIHCRPAGLLAASLASMQEINGIRLMDEFPVVSSKVLLSEPFMQLWIAIIILSGFLAFKQSEKPKASAFIILGGAIGLSALFRLNTIMIIPFIIFIAVFYYFRDKKSIFLSISVFLIGIFLAFTPWMIHNAIKYGNPIAFIKAKVSGVIVKERYEKIDNNINTSKSIEEEMMDFSNKDPEGTSPINFALSKSRSENSATMVFPGLNIQTVSFNLPSNLPQILVSIFRHFINNIITSFSILPTSINIQDLFHGSRNQRFWGGYEAATYEGINPLVLAINLLILSIGVSRAIKDHQIVGFLPMAVFLGYHLSSGMAISSGNRYAQPASWIIFFYFAIGLISISNSLLSFLQIDNQTERSEPVRSNNKNISNNIAVIALCVLAIGSIPIIADQLPISRFPKITEQQILSAIDNDENLKFIENGKKIREFISSNSLKVTYGRILTPVYLNNKEFKLIYSKSDFGAYDKYLTFIMLGPGSGNIKRVNFYTQNRLINVPNGSDAVIFFHEGDDNNALAIGIIDPIYSSQITTYKDIPYIPFDNFYFSENISRVE